jgi:hypothetical protein
MASRLYRTTWPLYRAVEQALRRLGLLTLGSPTWAAVVALATTEGALVVAGDNAGQVHILRLIGV